ncbi:hypothetical protein METHB2_20139 [Candidatus Methylobacter favarea]|uniref:Uncharacterized protein n=1 Tax=Candidatus Methylobacter favarea TaxID=2707345 RepID=A0A8S0Y9K7_9GAMM|nr:hypothetical protein [Candidatus Methylobacter favarea]CAA9890308.1 hypothetical protein METHB2_20139 [Candidatus Methylobacter favarea]
MNLSLTPTTEFRTLLFPASESEHSEIEDARFVRFVDDNDEATYYVTYTAYNDVTILPNLIKTADFVTFRAITLNGKAVRNGRAWSFSPAR